VRTFLILAKCSNHAVWKEQKDQILSQGSLLWPRNLLMMVARGERIREGGDEAVSVRAALKLEERFQGGLGLGNAGRVEEKMLGNTPYADYLVPGCDYISGLILRLCMPLRP
jgi:hypothetical protein